MHAAIEIEAFKAIQAIPFCTQQEAEKSKHAVALRAYEPIAREIRTTAGWYCREERADGPKLGYLINLQMGMLIQMVHDKKPNSLAYVVRMIRGSIRRKIKVQFGKNRRQGWNDDMPRLAGPKPKDPRAPRGSDGDSEVALTTEQKERIAELRIANPIINHCDWATKSDSGLPVVIRPRRRRGPRLNQEDAPGAVEWYSRRD